MAKKNDEIIDNPKVFGFEDFIKLQSEYHSDYVPRSRRYNVPIRFKPLTSFVENVVNTKVSNNDVVRIVTRVVRVPAFEHYSQFNCNDFRISTLLEAGVKLSICSIQVSSIQEVQRIVDHLNVVAQNELYLQHELESRVSESPKPVDPNKPVESN